MKIDLDVLDEAIEEFRQIRRRRMQAASGASASNYGGRFWELGAVASVNECIELLEELKKRVSTQRRCPTVLDPGLYLVRQPDRPCPHCGGDRVIEVHVQRDGHMTGSDYLHTPDCRALFCRHGVRCAYMPTPGVRETCFDECEECAEEALAESGMPTS